MEANHKEKNKNSGFVEIIVVILLALFILKFMNLTITDVTTWFKTTFSDVLR